MRESSNGRIGNRITQVHNNCIYFDDKKAMCGYNVQYIKRMNRNQMEIFFTP